MGLLCDWFGLIQLTSTSLFDMSSLIMVGSISSTDLISGDNDDLNVPM